MNSQQKVEPCRSIAARYKQSQAFLQDIGENKMALNATLYPIWIDSSDCFWYERKFRDDNAPADRVIKQYRLVNARSASNHVAFDHGVFANVLAEISKEKIEPGNLPINSLEMDLSPLSSTDNEPSQTLKVLRFTAFDRRWCFDLETGACTEIETNPDEWVISPDKKKAAFVKDYNIWIRDIESGKDHALTLDGEKYYVYGATGTAWGGPPGPAQLQIIWSPDSKILFTVQRDTRQVLTLPVVHHVPADGGIRPQLEEVKVAYPGDTYLEELRLLAIDINTGEICSADYPQIPVTRNSYGIFSAKMGWWAADSRRAYFVDVARDYKKVRVVEFDTQTGATRILFEEHSQTHINLMLGADDYPTFLPLLESNELLWFSERSGWGHLYLYDLDTGNLKSTVTSGKWLVRSVAHFEPKRREVFLQTAGRVSEFDPYYRDLVRVNVDNGELTTLVSSDHDNVTIVQTDLNTLVAITSLDIKGLCGVHPGGDFAVITRSRADEVPVSFLIDRDGKQVIELEVADISALPDNWQWPEPVKMLAADNETEIYGLVFRPTDFSPDRSYPVISHGFNNPEIPWVSKGAFTNGALSSLAYLDAAALAELGFIVVQIDGRGSSLRSKVFQDKCYGSFQTASLIDDHVAGIRQLAQRYPYMDLERVGVTAHASGGSGCVEGMLRYPEFFKVGVGSSLHDRRFMSAAMMGNKYEEVSGPREDHQYAEQLVENLQGKLLLIHGMLDWCTPPASAFRLIEALQRANKDFDMLLLPNLGHEGSHYITRRVFNYFVEHLLGEEIPV